MHFFVPNEYIKNVRVFGIATVMKSLPNGYQLAQTGDTAFPVCKSLTVEVVAFAMLVDGGVYFLPNEGEDGKKFVEELTKKYPDLFQKSKED